MGCYYLLLLEHRNQMTRHNAHITTLQYNYHFLVRTCTKRLYSVWLWRKRKSWPWPSKTPRSYMHSQSTNRLKWLAGIHAGQRSRSVSAGKPEKHSGVQPISEKQRDLEHALTIDKPYKTQNTSLIFEQFRTSNLPRIFPRLSVRHSDRQSALSIFVCVVFAGGD